MRLPRIIFAGTPEFAAHTLRRLHESEVEVACVITVPDKPAGRGQKLHQSDVKRYARELGLPLLQPADLRDAEFLRKIETIAPDLGVVVAFRKLPKELYRIPRLGFINLHASLLPQYRGAAPINWALIHGEQESGVTTFRINDTIDQGEIAMSSACAIAPNMTAGELHDTLALLGADLTLKSVHALCEGRLECRPQADIVGLRSAPKIFRQTCRIDLHAPAKQVHNLVRGLSPYPAAWTTIRFSDGKSINVKLHSSSYLGIVPNPRPHKPEPGSVIIGTGRDELQIQCGDGHYIAIREIHPANKKRMSVEAFLRGLSSTEMHFE